MCHPAGGIQTIGGNTRTLCDTLFRLGHGQGYQYAHDHEGHYVEQDYIPDERLYYEPTDEGYEKHFKERLEWLRKRKRAKKSDDASKE